MAKVRVIEVHENVFNTNNQEADALRKRLKDKKVTMINVMSSPGSGKTTLLSHVINEIKDDYKVGVMDVDIETSLDAQKVADFTGVPSIQIHNGGLCHIDAEMTTRAVDEFGVDDFEFSYRQICIILVAFIIQVLYYKIFRIKGNTKIALICYFITIINQMLLIFIIADSVLNGKSVFSLIIGFAYLMIINCFTAFELLESRRGENEITN